jgi:glycosyltransferase 2 family protein
MTAPPDATSSNSKGRRRRAAVAALQIAFTVALIALVVRASDWENVLRQLGRIDAAHLLACFALGGVQLLLLIWRWYLILICLRAACPLRAVVLGTLNERLINQLLPSTLGGDAVRASFLYKATSSLRDGIISVFLDRIAGLAGAAVTCTAAGALALSIGFGDTLVRSVTAVAAACAAMAVIGLLVPPPLIVRIASLPSLVRLRPIAVGWARVSRQLPFLFATVVLSIVIQLVFVAQFSLLANSLAPGLPIVTLLILTPVIMMTSAIPLTVAGWGMRESATIVLFSLAGVDTTVALAVSVLFGLVQLTIAIACGVVAMGLSLTQD